MTISAAAIPTGATIYSSGDRTDGQTYVTGTSSSISANTLLLACICLNNTTSGEEPLLSSVTGWSLTWTHISAADNHFKTTASGGKTLLYAALVGSAPGSGSCTATIDTIACNGGSIQIIQITGDFTGATTADEAIAQVALHSGGTSQSYTLPGATTTGSRSLIWSARNASTTFSWDSDWTEIGLGNHSAPTYYHGSAWSDNTQDSSATVSWGGGSGANGGFMIEIIEVPTAATQVTAAVLTTTPSLPAAKINQSITAAVLTTSPSLPAATVTEITSVTHSTLTTNPSLPTAQLDQNLTAVVLTTNPSLPVAQLDQYLTGAVLTVTPSLPTATLQVTQTLTHATLTITITIPTHAVAKRYRRRRAFVGSMDYMNAQEGLRSRTL